MNESSQKIIFTSSEPSLAVIYDTKSGLHSIYKIRKAFVEECQMVCGGNDTTSLTGHSTNVSSLNVGSNYSVNKSNRGHLSPFLLGKKISVYSYKHVQSINSKY